MISIVDYGMGNLRSVQKAFEEVGYPADLITHPEQLKSSNLLVLPGVGAFDRAVENLKNSGLWSVILKHLKAGRPYLGICLGLQLLFEGSEEGNRSGLGYFRGRVVRFRRVEPVPHMGWNELNWAPSAGAIAPVAVDRPCYYFVHSFYPQPSNQKIVVGRADYGRNFCVAVRRGNCLGVQFHPEKSQFAGLDLLRRFCGQVLAE